MTQAAKSPFAYMLGRRICRLSNDKKARIVRCGTVIRLSARGAMIVEWDQGMISPIFQRWARLI
jgi:hypothetical protein